MCRKPRRRYSCGNASQLIATNSTISGNYSGFHRAKTGTLTADYNNRVGGGLWSQSGNNRTVLDHVTITNNYTTSGGSGGGGGIYRSSGFIQAENSIIFGNVADADLLGTGGEDASDVRGAITLVGNNILGAHSTSGGGISGNTGGRIATDPGLLPLGGYGGFGRTHAILPDSSAEGAATGSTVATDQTGLGRPGAGTVSAPTAINSTGVDLLSDQNFTLLDPDRTPTVVGTSLNFPAGGADNEDLFSYQILPAGEFPASYPTTVTIDLDFTKITGDQDLSSRFLME